MTVMINDNELVLSGFVGGTSNAEDSFWDLDGFCATDVITALAQIGTERDVHLRINSGGGIATEGSAIYAALAAHKGKVSVTVEGIAASAASVVAMAGDTITMAPGSIMMIHDASGLAFGNAEDMQKTINALNAISSSYAGIYADRTGKPVSDVRDMMRAETWMTAGEAVEMGFADSTTFSNDNHTAEPSAFAYGMYAKAPERFVAMANTRGWKPRASLAAPAASPSRRKETSMTDQTEAATTTAETETTTTEVTTTTETVETTEPVTPDPVAIAAEIAGICAGMGMKAEQITAFIKDGGTVETAKARASEASEIKTMVASACKVSKAISASVADDMIAQGFTAENARKTLFDKIVASQSPEVSPHVAVDTKPAATAWSKQVDRINARTSAAS